MKTIGDAIDRLEEALFVGRRTELAAFQEWLELDSGPAVMFNVSGRGGVGKSTLLKAFERIARRSGRTVIQVDGRDFVHTPEGLSRAVCDGRDGDLASYLNARHPVLLLDTFEEMGDLGRYLLEGLLPKLATGVKVVIAGRHPIGAGWTDGWVGRRLVRSVELSVFSGEECKQYLVLRGLTDPALIEQVRLVAGGNPLAISLAADMVLQLGLREFAAAPEWHLAVRSLVERLLHDVNDSTLRKLLEAASVVRQFDEATLAAVVGDEEIGPAFARLCRMSVVRPTERGLILHDDVRRAIADDLRWRRSERYDEMKLRALAYYKGRMSSSKAADREWLLAELLFLWEDALTRSMVYNDLDPGLVWVDAARLEDHADIVRIWQWWRPNVLDKAVGFEGELPGDAELLEAMLRYPNCRVRVARGRDGSVCGFSTALPFCREAIPILSLHPAFAPTIQAFCEQQELGAVADTPEGCRAWVFVHVAHGKSMAETVQAVLMRDHIGLYALGDVYVIAAPHPDIKALLSAWGYERLPAAINWSWGPHHPVETFVLDLRRIGVERWIESILSGSPMPRPIKPSEVERELQLLLPRWWDDEMLAASPLLSIPAVSSKGAEADRARELRRVILGTLATEMTSSSSELAEAYRALDMAYIHREGTHEAVAEQLSVSRATFYRLLKRATHGLAEAVSRS